MIFRVKNMRLALGSWARGFGRVIDLDPRLGLSASVKSPEECLAEHWKAVGGYIASSMQEGGLGNGHKKT